MSRERIAIVRQGLIGSGVLAAAVALAVFYAVVSGAVSRAADRQSQWSQAAQSVPVESRPGLVARGRRDLLVAGASN